MAEPDQTLNQFREFQRFRQRAEDSTDAVGLKNGGGGGTSGGVTEDWKANVDRQLDQLHKDVRALLRWGVAAVVGLAAMIATVAIRTDAKFEAVNARIGAVEVQQAHIIDKLDLLLERSSPRK